MPFSGFGPETIQFLEDLGRNNNRDWFQDHKIRYERLVLAPALDFIDAMGGELHRISPYFLAMPKRVGGSLMRVYRDTRFSRDKTPYKTNIGIQLRHERGRDVHAPGFYVHLDPDECFIGAGLWHPESAALAAIRARIAEDPGGWRRARDGKRFREHFALSGSTLARPPRGFGADDPMIEDIKRKDFIAVSNLPVAAAGERDFAREVARRFTATKPFMAFLCAALALEF